MGRRTERPRRAPVKEALPVQPRLLAAGLAAGAAAVLLLASPGAVAAPDVRVAIVDPGPFDPVSGRITV
ncbi:MAG: hypothetical protein ACOC7L_01365, partial [Acidobacteriota bacterium]